MNEATKAMLSSERFNGEQLNPWAVACPFAADSMGMKFPFIGDDGVKEWKKRGVYPGQLVDVAIFIWLRTGDTQQRVEQALNDPSAAKIEAAENAASLGINTYRSTLFKEAAKLMFKTLDEAQERKPETDSSEGEGSSDPL